MIKTYCLKAATVVSLLFFILLTLSNPSHALPVDLFPVPVSDVTTLFPIQVDDDYLQVTFEQGFTFDFYGTTYSSIYLNTNGGFTFGAGSDNYYYTINELSQPGVAVFWGDMDASKFGADTRPNQMVYEQFSDRFVITYTRIQDMDNAALNNSATVTLYANGNIVIEYGQLLSRDILIGVFDGSHTDDRFLPVQQNYFNYASTGTGIILFEPFVYGPVYAGELDNKTITFNVGPPSQPYISVSPTFGQFGSLEISDLAAQTFTITNAGTDLLIGTLSITGTNASEFSIQNDNCSGQTLGQFANCVFVIQFAPVSFGDKSADLLIPSNDPDTPTLNVVLGATGVAVIKGDLNDDDVIDILDVILVLRKALGWE